MISKTHKFWHDPPPEKIRQSPSSKQAPGAGAARAKTVAAVATIRAIENFMLTFGWLVVDGNECTDA